jgi:hypothetical protein
MFLAAAQSINCENIFLKLFPLSGSLVFTRCKPGLKVWSLETPRPQNLETRKAAFWDKPINRFLVNF